MMGGKWSIRERNLKDDSLKVCWYGDSFWHFLIYGIRCIIMYEVVILGKHGR